MKHKPFSKITFRRPVRVIFGLILMFNMIFSPSLMAGWVEVDVWIPRHYGTIYTWIPGHYISGSGGEPEWVDGYLEVDEGWIEGHWETRVEWVDDDEENNGDESTREPIHTATGSNYFTEERLFVPAAGMPLELNLDYQSVSGVAAGSLGSGWRHSYEWSLLTETNQIVLDTGFDIQLTETNQMVLDTGFGSRLVFSAQTNGLYSAPEGSGWELSESAGEYDLWMPNGKTYQFDSAGKLSAIQDAWGNRIDCTYTTNNCLEAVTHANGRQLLFSNEWNTAISEWRTVSIRVEGGAALDFSYNADGLFTQIVERVGLNSYTSTYQYADGFLTNKVDGAGFEYSFDYETQSDGTLNGRGTSLAVDGYYEHEVEYTDNDTTDVTYHRRGSEQVYRYSRADGRLAVCYGPGETVEQALERGVRYEYATNRLDKIEETIFDNDTETTWSQWMLYDDAHNLTNLLVGYNTTNPVLRLSMQYDPVWKRPVSITDAEGGHTELAYTNGSPFAQKAFYSETQSHDTVFSYSTNGLLQAVTNANGHATRLSYNALGDRVTVAAEAGPIFSNTYNSLGFTTHSEVLSEDGISSGRITQYDVDEKGQVLCVTDPDGLSSSFEYNALGYFTRVVDRAGRPMDLTYAPTRKLTSITQYLNHNGSNVPVRVSYDYDEQFNTLSITEPRGRYVESYQLDVQDRITAVTNIEGQVMTLDYSVGNLVNDLYRFDGSRIRMNYDEAGRVSSRDYCAGEGDQWVFDDYDNTTNLVLEAALVTVSNSYYPDGQLKTISDGTSSVSNTYDRLNRLTNQVVQIGNQQSAIHNTFDPVGNLTNSVVSIGDSSTNSLKAAYAYDVAERLTSISTSLTGATNSMAFSYAYSPQNGRIASITNLESGLVSSYAYDIMDRATNISYRTSNGSLIRSLDYEYDALGMIREKTDFNASTTSTVSTAYTYDSVDRLVCEETIAQGLKSTVFYSYDLAGNRLSKTGNTLSTAYTLGEGNRLAAGNTQAADALFVSGSSSELIGTDNRWGRLYITNLTTGASVVPEVNGQDFYAMISVQASQSNTLVAAIRDIAGNVGYATNQVWVGASTTEVPEVQSYAYDAAGCLISNCSVSATATNLTTLSWDERYRLTSVDEASSLVSYTYDVYGRRISRTENSNSVYFVYNGNQVVADLDESGNLLRSYTWGSGIDNLLAMTVYTNGGAQASATYYAIKDHLNSIIAFVDANGSVVESYEYDAWGRTRVFDANGNELTESAISNRYCFQGREIDWSTGFYYFRARWYDPVTGRWLSKDPIGISGGLNLYAFCGNNPVNFTDPMGRCPENVVVEANILIPFIELANNPHVIYIVDNLLTWLDGLSYWVTDGGPQAMGDWLDDVRGPGSSSGGSFQDMVDEYNHYNSGSEEAVDDLYDAIGW